MHLILMYICKKRTYMQLEKIINTAYSFGAAVVVFGAWAKIEHKEYSDDALTVGLLVETGIFCIYGLLEWRRQPAGVPEAHAGQPQMDPMMGGTGAGGPEVGELTETMKQTNRILNKVFRAGE
jgi:hypothetical protein